MAPVRKWGRDRIPGAGRRFASFVSGFLYLLLCLLLQTCLLCQCAFPLYAWAAEGKAGSAETAASRTELLKDYNEYEKRFQELETLEDLEPGGYQILEDQVFPVVLESFGQEELTLVPAMERTWKRLALFVADAQGQIVYKCNQLETNNSIRGRMLQCTREIAAVSFVDVNRDGRTDILLITKCVNDVGDYQGIPYKVGDVLFQGEKTFYRDWRISDKINRFGRNKSANCMSSFVRDGESAEFLYTATTLSELLENGFAIEAEQNYTRNFEKLGRLQVVPGTMRISEYNFFMIYLVNEQGDIVWSLQPMGDYDSLYSLKGINGRDVDGDGMKDLVVLARYSREDTPGELKVETRCSIYYQRTNGFELDTEFEKTYHCTEEDTMEEMIGKIREYWGWQIET